MADAEVRCSKRKLKTESRYMRDCKRRHYTMCSSYDNITQRHTTVQVQVTIPLVN